MVALFQPKLDCILPGYDILITNYWTKNPSDGEVLAHQNWSHVDESKHRSYSIWIPLQDTDQMNGTMEVVPKSHLVFTEPRGVNMEYPYESPFKAIGADIRKEYLMPINLKAGQAVIIDDAIVHYTGPNRSEKPRLAIQLVVKPKDAPGEFYFKHKNIVGENNVEIFHADYHFYTKFSLTTRGNERPSHGITKKFITHHTEKMTMEKFRALMQKVSSGNTIHHSSRISNRASSIFMKMTQRIKKLLQLK
jgi:hypothetical protein